LREYVFTKKKKSKSEQEGREKCHLIGCHPGGAYIALTVMEYNGSLSLGGSGANAHSFLFAVLLGEVCADFSNKMCCFHHLPKC
jgi:hypothetical protein